MIHPIYPGFHPGLFILVPFGNLIYDICMNDLLRINKLTSGQFTIGSGDNPKNLFFLQSRSEAISSLAAKRSL